MILIESWRRRYNTVRPHSSLGYKPPAPEAVLWPPVRHPPGPPTDPATPAVAKAAYAPTVIPDHPMGEGQLQPAVLTSEHILPQKPGRKRADVLQADPNLAEEYIYRLGDVCLLTEVNRKLGRKDFQEKRKVFRRGNLLTTQDVDQIGQDEQWGVVLWRSGKLNSRSWPSMPGISNE